MKPSRVIEIYERLDKLVIELDPDPVSRGPKYLIETISSARGYLNEVSIYLTETLREKHVVDMELHAAEAAYEVTSDELLATDRSISQLPNIEDRKAAIHTRTADERKAIQALRRVLRDLGHVEKVIKHRHKELDNTISNVRMQRSLIEAEARTGSFYGSETETSGSQAVKDFSESEIQDLFDGIEGSAEPEKAATKDTRAPSPSVNSISADELDELLAEETLGIVVGRTENVLPVPKVYTPQPSELASLPEDPAISRFLDDTIDLDGLFD